MKKDNDLNEVTIEETEQIREDYVYEIVDENDDIIETDFVCLESAIEYALENGGVCINRLMVSAR